MRLRDADRQPRRLGIGLEELELGKRLGREVDPVTAVDLLHLALDAVAKRLLEIAEIGEIIRCVAGANHGLGKHERAFAALEPVVGDGERSARTLRHSPHELALLRRVGVECVEADDGLDSAAADDVDVGEQVVTALLQELEVLRRVDGIERKARLDGRRAAMRLQGAHGRHQNHGIGLQARAAALDVPELLVAHVRSEAALRHHVIAERAGEAIGDDRVLPDRDVGERPGVHEHRLALDRLHQRRLDCVHQEGAHRAVHLEIGGRHWCAGLRVGHDDLREPPAKIRQVGRHRENRHHLRGDGDVEAGVAGIAIESAAATDRDAPQPLCAEVHRPAELDALRVDVQPLQAAFSEPGVVMVALVLQARVERDHGQVVGIGDRIDVAGETERERRERNHLGKPAAGGGALDVEGRPARGLAHAPDHFLAEPPQALDKAERGRRLPLAERGRGDRRDVDVLGALSLPDSGEHLRDVDLREVAAVRIPFALLDAKLANELGGWLHAGLGRLGDLPVLHLRRIQRLHQPSLISSSASTSRTSSRVCPPRRARNCPPESSSPGQARL